MEDGFGQKELRLKKAVDIITISLFVASYIAKMTGLIIVTYEDEAYAQVQRPQWPWYEPRIISDIFFSYGVVFVFGKILFYFKISRYIGLLQYAMGEILTDIALILFLVFLSLVSFSLALLYIYEPYKERLKAVIF